jgi:porin
LKSRIWHARHGSPLKENKAMSFGFAVVNKSAPDLPSPGPSIVCASQPAIPHSNSARLACHSFLSTVIFCLMTLLAVADMHAQTAPVASASAKVAQAEVQTPVEPAAAAPKPEPTPAQMGGILKGQILLMPPGPVRTFVPFNNFRKELEQKYGVGVYAISQTLFARNTLSPAVPYAQIAYPGNNNFYQSSSYLTLTYDMRAFHLSNAQLVLDGAIQKVSWYPGGPESVDFDEATIYKGFLNDNLQFKAGYMSNAEEFIQMKVGGLANNGAAGVLGVLPYNVGMSNKPQQAPSFNIRENLPNHFYAKVGFQRSYSPMGSVGEQAQDKVGFRFAPGPVFDAAHGVYTKGDKLLTIAEVDYQKSQYKIPMQLWIRAGYMNNQTKYRNYNSNQYDTKNYLLYLVGDKQLTQPDPANQRHGLFIGGSAMYTPPAVNKYYQYYEARAYYSGPFKSRPSDFFSLVGAHSVYSPDLTKSKPAGMFSKSSWALTPTYNLKLYRQAYWVNALGYTQGPVPGAKYRNTLIYNAMLMVFF